MDGEVGCNEGGPAGRDVGGGRCSGKGSRRQRGGPHQSALVWCNKGAAHPWHTTRSNPTNTHICPWPHGTTQWRASWRLWGTSSAGRRTSPRHRTRLGVGSKEVIKLDIFLRHSGAWAHARVCRREWRGRVPGLLAAAWSPVDPTCGLAAHGPLLRHSVVGACLAGAVAVGKEEQKGRSTDRYERSANLTAASLIGALATPLRHATPTPQHDTHHSSVTSQRPLAARHTVPCCTTASLGHALLVPSLRGEQAGTDGSSLMHPRLGGSGLNCPGVARTKADQCAAAAVPGDSVSPSRQVLSGAQRWRSLGIHAPCSAAQLPEARQRATMTRCRGDAGGGWQRTSSPPRRRAHPLAGTPRCHPPPRRPGRKCWCRRCRAKGVAGGWVRWRQPLSGPRQPRPR